MMFIPPAQKKKIMSNVFNFSWGDCNTHDNFKTKVMLNFGGQTRCIMGDVQMADPHEIK